MDRILQALQRAKDEGDGVVSHPSAARLEAATPIQPAAQARRTGSTRQTGASLDTPIVYTRTRTVPVSAEGLRSRRAVVPGEAGPAAEAYRMLGTQVLQSLRDNSWNALAVVSAGFREGKSLTAVNLAISLSMEVGHTVLLVDADLRRPSVHEYFGASATPGLSDHLLDGVPLDDILFNPSIDRLVVLPAGRRLPTSSELLGSPRMADLVQELKQRYPARIVLFDLPPILSAADVLAFAPHVDAAIMVVEERRTSPEDVQRAAELLGSTRLIGTVLNRSVHHDTRDDESRTDHGAGTRTRGPWSRYGWFARLSGFFRRRG